MFLMCTWVIILIYYAIQIELINIDNGKSKKKKLNVKVFAIQCKTIITGHSSCVPKQLFLNCFCYLIKVYYFSNLFFLNTKKFSSNLNIPFKLSLTNQAL